MMGIENKGSLKGTRYLSRKKKIHLIGIGGIGVSGIAKMLIQQGYQVSGSDLVSSDTTDELKKLAASIYVGHKAEQGQDKDLVIYSAAIQADNLELKAARESSAEVLSRGEMLARMMAEKGVRIAIAGAHGKTTVTSMITQILQQAGKDPTALIGGKLQCLGDSNACSGKSDIFVAEVCESDGTFLKVSPTLGVITSIDDEHRQSFVSSKDLDDCFIQFANKTIKNGKLFINIDHERTRNILNKLEEKNIVTYGVFPEAQLYAKNIRHQEDHCYFEVHQQEQTLGKIQLQVPGEHNVANAIAAMGVAMAMDIPWPSIEKGLAAFHGLKRRFQIKQTGKVMLVDDYAHHPTEIAATLKAAKQGWPERRLIAVIQPHRYTRLRDLMQEFAACVKAADMTVITDVYSAHEKPIDGIHSQKLFEHIQQNYPKKDAYYAASLKDVETKLKEIAQANDLIILLGAGDIWKVANNSLHI